MENQETYTVTYDGGIVGRGLTKEAVAREILTDDTCDYEIRRGDGWELWTCSSAARAGGSRWTKSAITSFKTDEDEATREILHRVFEDRAWHPDLMFIETDEEYDAEEAA
jgi:hypothetical protein